MLRNALGYSQRYRNLSIGKLDPNGPIVLAGHQPELFHAGVWFKNVVLSNVGQRVDGTAVNLVIDNDTLAAPSIRVPTGSEESPRVESISFDKPCEVVPFESRSVVDVDHFTSFATRVRHAGGDMLPPATILDSLWPTAVERIRDGMLLGESLAAARHAYEERWGLQTLELPLSQVCQGEPFRRFLLHIAADLHAFRSVYNASLSEYRRVHKLRSRSHPAPDLAEEGEYLEAPFWIWSAASPRRAGLYVRRSGSRLELTDRDQLSLSIDLVGDHSFDTAIEQISDWEANGIRLRPRALITTMFARLFLSDLFLHGIGGAKYDQLTDAIIGRYFEIEPPAYMTVTATVYPPYRLPPVEGVDLTRLRRQQRELEYHAEKHIDFARHAEAKQFCVAKARAIRASAESMSPADRHAAIVSANESMQPFVQSQRDALAREQEETESDLRRRKLLRSREFSFCLFEDRYLRELWLEEEVYS